jgi:hypothetical protein
MKERMPPVPVGERPFTDQRFSTKELPDTPTRDFRIPASGWHEAPHVLLHLGGDLDQPVGYIRRIGRWLLWRAGPPVGRARYMAVSENGSPWLTFDLNAKQGSGIGAAGERHERFRTWKESLQEHRPRE